MKGLNKTESAGRRRTSSIVILVLWALFALGIVCVSLFFILLSKGKIGNMPSVEDLENPIDKYATQVISADGVLLCTYSQKNNNRVQARFDELSPYLVQALISTEDIRFQEHSGIDLRALTRAVIKRVILQQKSAGGGSTITQQLAKQLFTPDPARSNLKRAMQKPGEWVIALKLERYYTKEEIIALYFDKCSFVNNVQGIYSASNAYFGKTPAELNVQEAAMFVGMCQNPSLYNPLRFKDRARERRNVVLSQMEKYGYLTQEQCDSIQNLDIELNYHSVDHTAGLATYFRQYLSMTMNAKKPVRKDYSSWDMQRFYEDSIDWIENPLFGWCNKNTSSKGEHYNLYTDGLKVYVTIDSRMQRYAEEAVDSQVCRLLQPQFFKSKKNQKTAPFSRNITQAEVDAIMTRAMNQSGRASDMRRLGISNDSIRKVFNTPVKMTLFSYSGYIDTVMTPMDSLRYMKYYLRTGFMCMEPKTGYVRAYVGGPDFRAFKYDMVTKGRRQVGSTMKPYLYSLAMESGFSPCDQVINQTQTILTESGQIWRPKDDGTKMLGQPVTLKWGLANSNNNVTAYLMSKLSPYAFVDLLHEYGLRNQAIDPVESLCLGTCDVSVEEMVSAYTSFVNHGIRTMPLYVTRIEDSEGNVLAQFSARSNEVVSEETSFRMIDMMRAVINEGTGTRLRSSRLFPTVAKVDIGGKTGTTDNHSDAWFMGYTPELVAGCWVGGDDRDIHFDSMEFGQGAHAALPVWGMFMENVYRDSLSLGYSPSVRFDLPAGYDPCAGYEDQGGDLLDSYGLDSF